MKPVLSKPSKVNAVEITDETIRAAVAGSRIAVELTVVWAMPRVSSHLRKKFNHGTGRDSELEDIAQETLSALARAIHRLRNQTVQGLWGLTAKIAERKVYKKIKRLQSESSSSPSLNHRLPKARAIPLTTMLSQTLFAKSPSPTTAAERQERIERTLLALERLDAIDREIVRLAIYEKKILREICESLNGQPDAPPTAEAVRKRLARALKKLQGFLVPKDE